MVSYISVLGTVKIFQGGICVCEVCTMYFIGRVDGVQEGYCCWTVWMIKTSIPLPSNIDNKDRSWVDTYKSETKHQPTKWHTNMSPQKKKPQVRKSQQNVVLIIVCYSVCGALWVCPVRWTVNFAFYVKSSEVLEGCHLVESYPIRGLDRPLELQSPRISRQHMKV